MSEKFHRKSSGLEKDEPESQMRRGLIRGLGVIAASGWAANHFFNQDEETSAKEATDENMTESVTEEDIQSELSPEVIAENLESPVFERVLNARTIEAGGLNRTQVIFVDSFGRQLSEPFTLSESLGVTVEAMTWRGREGKPEGITGTWTKEQKAYVSEHTGVPISEIDILHVYLDLDNADQKDFTSRVEAVYHNANKAVEGDVYGRSELSFLRDEFKLKGVPENIAVELQSYVVGLASEESRFDPSKVSSTGAVGIMQTMPKTVAKYQSEKGLESLNPLNLNEQLPVAIAHLESVYRSLTNNLETELTYFTDTYFSGNTASMEKYLLVPMILNSYNVGQARMKQVVQWFLDKYKDPEVAKDIFDTKEKLSGYDVYFAMVHQCHIEKGVPKFGSDSSSYVEKIMGWQKAFNEYEEKRVMDMLLASN